MNQGVGFNRKLIALVLVLLFGAVTVFLIAGDDKPSDNTAQTFGPKAANDSTNINPDETPVAYEGFKELASRGLTSFQMQGVRYALFQFAPEADRFSVNITSIKTTPYDRNRPQAIVPVTFTITIDKTVYSAKVDKYNDLTTVRLHLFDGQGKQVFDSQPVDSRKVDAAETAPGE